MVVIKCFGPVEAEMSLVALSCCSTTAASKSICGLLHTHTSISIFVGTCGDGVLTLILPTNSLILTLTPLSQF